MGYATPNRVADPVQLEQFKDPGILRQVGGLLMPYFNESTTDTILMGEPLVFGGRVWVAMKPILPQTYGTVVADFVGEFLLDTAHTGDINQGDVIYWDTDVNVVTYYGETTVLAGIGGASGTLPDNGFILGYALGNKQMDLGVDGSSDLLAAQTGSKTVTVVSLAGNTTSYTA